MDFMSRDFTGVHVWYKGKAWVVRGHDHDEGTVTLFHPDEETVVVKEGDIDPRR